MEDMPADLRERPMSEYEAREIAIQRYASVNSYMAYEGQTYWTRAQFFLAANAILTALMVQLLPTTVGDTNIPKLAIGLICAGVGLALTWLWVQSLKAGEYWLNHWQSALKTLEKAAYDDLLLHRDFTPKPGRVSAKRVAYHTAYLFYGVWIGAIVYLIVAAVRFACARN